MATKYVLLDWSFDAEKFSEVLSALDPETLQTCQEMMGVSRAAIYHWRTGKYGHDKTYPNMTNFVALCNLLDLDPRDFFTLE